MKVSLWMTLYKKSAKVPSISLDGILIQIIIFSDLKNFGFDKLHVQLYKWRHYRRDNPITYISISVNFKYLLQANRFFSKM